MVSIVEFIKMLDSMSTAELQDYLEQYWHGDFELTPQEEWHLVERIRKLKVDQMERYIIIWVVLLALVSIDAEKVTPITSIFNRLTEPDITGPYDYIWVTEGDDDVCPLCAPLNGKIYGVDFTLKPKLHPNCRCELEKRPKAGRAMRMRRLEAGAVRAIETNDKRQLEVLAAPFGNENNKDRYEQWFTSDTDFMIEVGDRRPTLYLHGASPQGRSMDSPPVTGISSVTRVDEQGLWMIADLDNSELATRTWEAALRGEAKASTGSVNYLVRPPLRDGKWPPGPVKCWPIAELSVFDGGENRVPVSDDALVIPLRALFEQHSIDYPFEAGEDKDEVDPIRLDNKRTKMSQEEVAKQVASILAEKEAEKEAAVEAKAALRAEIEAELKKEAAEDPENFRQTFTVGGKESKRGAASRITPGEKELGFTAADKEEEEAFMWNMCHPQQAPKAMRSDNADPKRVLEETQAAEGGGLIPLPVINKINALRQEYSLIDAIGFEKVYTNSLNVIIPREDAGSAVFATIAEEGAYVANEPAYSGNSLAMVKKGSMITVTEEMLEDATMWEPAFYRSMGTWWAMTENLDLFTILKATSTTGLHSATWTAAEVDTFPFFMTEPWTKGSHIVMEQATAAAIRALLVATPRAYGSFSDFNDLYNPKFFGIPVHINSNWETLGGGDTDLIASHVSPGAITYVERRGMSIKVDPYGDALNGRIRYFPSYRAAIQVTQVLGNVDWTDHA